MDSKNSNRTALEAIKRVDTSQTLDQDLVARLRATIVDLGHQKRQQEIHVSMKKSYLLTLRAQLAEKAKVAVRVDEHSTCARCHRNLNGSTVCALIDGRIHCSKCGNGSN
jgi:hypothetical protein